MKNIVILVMLLAVLNTAGATECNTILLADILHHQSGYCESEDGSDVCRGAVDLRFRRAPLVVGKFRGAFPDREFRTHAGTGPAGAGWTFVGQ